MSSLTIKQEQGLKIAIDKYNNHEPYVCIAGYAGTGKTYLIRHIIEALGVNPNNVAYIAPTGKAAEVLRKNGNPNAMTAHKLLYYSKKNPDGTFLFKPRARIEDYEIIVCDEISMLSKDLWNLLLGHHKFVIASGDPFQLSPVMRAGESDQNNHVLEQPDIFLDEVMRQAQDNEIIKVSMDIRAGRPLQYHKGNDVYIIPKGYANVDMYNWGDQIIVGTNAERYKVNNAVRESLGFEGDPKKGDKVISLGNHWACLDSSGEASLVNGTIGYIRDIYSDTIHYPVSAKFKKDFPNEVPVYHMDIRTENYEYYDSLMVDRQALTSYDGNLFLNPYQEYAITKSYMCTNGGYIPPYEFNYGYAITCHRAQGSQWDKVLIIEERFPFDKTEHARWLYTAVTRAAKKVVLLR